MKTTASIALVTAFSLSSLLSGVVARADERPMKACEMMFIPRTEPVKRVMTNAAGQEIDERGNVIGLNTVAESKGSAPKLQLVTAQGHNIYDVEAIRKLLVEDSGLTESMKSEYKKMIEKGGARMLVHVSNLSMLDPLYELMPNFKTTLDRVKRAMMVSIMSGEPIVLPPIILLGEPGVGKTFFAELLAEAIGTGYGFIPMNSTTAGWILAGSAATWSTASMGKVARILIEGKYANPVIVVDEIDKAGSSGKQYDPLSAFYQLWESHTAKNFTDEFLRVNIDASLINWIATANYADQIPDPIRKRAIVVEVPSPSEGQLRVIVNNVLAIFLKKHPGLNFSGVISDEVFATFKKNTPRDIRMLIQDAVGGALIANRTELKPEDIDKAILHESEQAARRPIGFVYPE